MKIKWIQPKFDSVEHKDEVVYQYTVFSELLPRLSNLNEKFALLAMLAVLQDEKKFRGIIQSKTPKNVSFDSIKKQICNLDKVPKWSGLSEEKKNKITKQILNNSNPSIECPILLQLANNKYLLLAGKTRMSYCLQNNIELKKMLVITHRDIGIQ